MELSIDATTDDARAPDNLLELRLIEAEYDIDGSRLVPAAEVTRATTIIAAGISTAMGVLSPPEAPKAVHHFWCARVKSSLLWVQCWAERSLMHSVHPR